jgi:hypothetical protein
MSIDEVRADAVAAKIIDCLNACRSDEEREYVLGKVFDEFCRFCGSDAGNGCYCMRDD